MPVPPIWPAPAYRFNVGDTLSLVLETPLSASNSPAQASAGVVVFVRMLYDDGTPDEFQLTVAAPAQGATTTLFDRNFSQSGVIVDMYITQTGTNPDDSVYAILHIQNAVSQQVNVRRTKIFSGYLGSGCETLGFFEPQSFRTTWVFQGTVAEDATVGTHVCTLTVSPGVGNAMELMYAEIVATGAAGLVQRAYITDGTNEITELFNATTAGTYAVPSAIAAAGGTSAGARIIISGSQQLVLKATTSTVSDTQTFSVAARLKKPLALPTATLADNTGTPTLTVNTNGIF